MVDDDNPIPPETLEVMLADDKDIVVAAILGRNPSPDGKHKMCAFYSDEVVIDGKPLKVYLPIESWRDDDRCIESTPAALDVCSQAPGAGGTHAKHQNYFFEFGDVRLRKFTYQGKTYDRRTMSEDCEFSERALAAGFELWLDERIRPVHLTTMGGVKYNG